MITLMTEENKDEVIQSIREMFAKLDLDFDKPNPEKPQDWIKARAILSIFEAIKILFMVSGDLKLSEKVLEEFIIVIHKMETMADRFREDNEKKVDDAKFN